MGWTCQGAGVEPGVARAQILPRVARQMARQMSRAMAPGLAPGLAIALVLSLVAPAYGGTSYHRFASGLGMNIRHLPCVSRRTGEAGTCMFAYSCAKANGTHLGTCIDRFYFGSCCRLAAGVVIDELEHVGIEDDSNFIDDNNIATSERPKPSQTITPGYTSTISHISTTTVRIPPSTPGYVSSQKPPSSTQRPQPTTATYPSTTQRPSSFPQVTTGSPPTKKYPVITTSRFPPRPTTPVPTLVTWTTIDGFPPRKPPSIGSSSSISPASSTTHRTPATKPPVTIDNSRPTSIFNTTSGSITITSPKPSSLKPTRPSVTVITNKPTNKPTYKPTYKPTIQRPLPSTSSRPSTVVNTSKPSTLLTSRPPSQKPFSPSTSSKPSSKPSVKPTKPSTKPPVRVTVKPSGPKPVTSVTIVSTPKPTSAKPTKPDLTGSKPSRPSSQKPSTQKPLVKPSTIKPTSPKPVAKPTSKPTSKPTAKPSVKPTRPKPTKPSKPSTTIPTTSKPIKLSTLLPQTMNTEPSTDPDWVQVSVSSHEPSLQTTIFLTTDNPWTSGRPGVTEASTLPVTGTAPFFTFPGPGVTLPTATSSPTDEPPPETNEVLNINMTDFRDVCGRRLFPEPRIVGGNKSTFGKWPWQISLRQWRTSTYLHKCGAALLSENWAITAAHCVENVPPSDLLLRLGEYDLSVEDEPYTFQERRVQIVASHPQFDPRTFEYDLALLRFYDPVNFQPNIIPICVPEDDTNFVGRTAFVTGWGRLYEDGPLPSILQEVSVPVINNTVCETMYRAAGYIEHIPDIFICAGWKKGGFDSCEGDSGGPMVIERADDKRWALAGVISWGIGCAEPNQPGVYTRISHFRHWINQILQF